MINRTSIALSVLAAAGLAATDAGRDAATALIPTAGAQEPEESTQRGPEAGAQSEQETEVARADQQDAPQAGIPLMSIGITESDEHGEYIVDEHGRALYLLEGEDQGESNCYDECAQNWPPALALQSAGATEDQPAQPQQGIDEGLLGTFERRDGALQITYGDYPLYYYHEDISPGEASGHDVTDEWGEWYLVSPEGEPVGHDEGE